MNEIIISLNNKTFKLKFGLKVFRALGELWGTPSLNSTMARFSLFETATDDLTFEQIDVISDLIITAIESNPENEQSLSRDEIDDLFLSETALLMNAIEIVMKGLMASLPQSKPIDQGKQIPRKK
jgi:hypothetical protein